MDEKVLFIEVQNVFSTKKLNISEESVAKQEDIDRWPYLSGVKLPAKLTSDHVAMLIGVDVPEALQPDEIIKSQQGGPYAVRNSGGR